MIYKPGTRIKFTEEELIEMALSRISRIAYRGFERIKYVFLEHEANEVLKDLTRDIKLLYSS